MMTRGLVCGITKIPHIKRICHSCVLGKHNWQRFPKHRSTVTTRPLQIVHSDLCGPMPITSRTSHRYLLTFIDDFTSKTWLYFLSEKSQTLEKFKEFCALVEKASSKIENLRSDRGENISPKTLMHIVNIMVFTETLQLVTLLRRMGLPNARTGPC
jgi:hypothetical protein